MAGVVLADSIDQDTIEVDLSIAPYAEIDAEDIKSNDWIDFENPINDSLKERLAKVDNRSDTTGKGENHTFSGRGGEAKWARKDITIKSNTPILMTASASYPVHDDGETTLHDEENGAQTFYSWLQTIDKAGDVNMIGPITPGEGDEWISVNDTNGTINGLLASKVVMPEEFWEVKAGEYLGMVTFTVQAK